MVSVYFAANASSEIIIFWVLGLLKEILVISVARPLTPRSPKSQPLYHSDLTHLGSQPLELDVRFLGHLASWSFNIFWVLDQAFAPIFSYIENYSNICKKSKKTH